MKIFSFKNLIVLNFLLSNMMFSLNRKHLLIILLSLELIMLNMFLLIFNFMMFMGGSYFLMMFMILSVCEGVLGLSVLVYLVRIYGNDLIKIYSFI
uniref:NADH-ubiquinone oxidoreductase chain 4L n=1 Tax=Lepidostoma longipilosum TaxID=2904889 RepID=A0A9E8LNI3_9NEOP|nr:NADH dehydrogenase subunit 4L [Lepidostoma longipilosum]UZZ43645.1 NADH dehydrogenase subunit 4L [Lepidostoma longipilosum]